VDGREGGFFEGLRFECGYRTAGCRRRKGFAEGAEEQPKQREKDKTETSKRKPISFAWYFLRLLRPVLKAEPTKLNQSPSLPHRFNQT
jgi:hypothetical protein